MKLKITYLGTPKEITTKFGPKQKNSIKASESEYGDSYLSFWVSPVTSQWKVGDTVEVDAVNPREYNGKTYYDIQMPKANSVNPELSKKLEEVLNSLMTLKLASTQIKLGIEELLLDKRARNGEKLSGEPNTPIDYPEMPESEDNGIPF